MEIIPVKLIEQQHSSVFLAQLCKSNHVHFIVGVGVSCDAVVVVVIIDIWQNFVNFLKEALGRK